MSAAIRSSSADQVAAYLHQHETKGLLRFITCGSVDDGKSTLIGRLLHDSKLLFEDQLAALRRDSIKHGTQGDEIDFALLVDGLEAEREQGITIDVAYRFFDTDQRKFIVADCPGHEQYTRNMATGASAADAAVVLVDARKGLLTQTRRHSYIVALLGLREVIVAVNKMDLVDHDETVFRTIESEYLELAHRLGLTAVRCIPVSALRGDNIMRASEHMPWYRGPSLLQALEAIDTGTAAARPARLAVQWVCRPHQDFRGFAGSLRGGPIALGDALTVLPSGRRSTITRIFRRGVEADRAQPGDPVVVALADEIDVSRGDVLVDAGHPLEITDQFAAHLLWMRDEPLMPGRPYLLKLGSRTVGASVTEIKHKVDVNSQAELAAKSLGLNEVALCNISLDAPLPFASYREQREFGSFILIDRQSNTTAGAGVVEFALRRAANIHWQHLDLDKQARARAKAQTPRCLWFTGLSGSGKSTIANLVDKQLHARGLHTYLLDGDNVRHGLCKDLGFTNEDRVENIRRVAEVARLMVDAGLIVLVSFISPFRAERRMARELFAPDGFIGVFVDTPLAVAEQRDVKGLYAKARAGQIPNFTGISAPYEAPEHAELVLHTTEQPAAELASRVVTRMLEQST